MREKMIFEFNLSNDLKLYAYEDKNYTYYGSHLNLKHSILGEIEIVQGSFAYEFGMEMYIRLFNINEYNGKDIIKYMEKQLNNISESLYNYDKYIFVNGANEQALLLYKNDDYHLTHIKYNRKTNTKVYKAEILFDILISEEQLSLWRNIIIKEFKTRAKKESEIASNRKFNDVEWTKYLDSLKDEKKDYKNK